MTPVDRSYTRFRHDRDEPTSNAPITKNVHVEGSGMAEIEPPMSPAALEGFSVRLVVTVKSDDKLRVDPAATL